MHSNIRWYINRLKSMSIVEVGYRLLRTLTQKKDVNLDSFKVKVEFKINEAVLSELKESLELYNNNVIEAAENFKRHIICLFGNNYNFSNEINWRVDIKNNKITPLIDSRKINYRDSNNYGNVKYIWELNRFLHLPTMAIAYSRTRDKKLLEDIKYQILSWIEQNPYMKGINWSSSLEAAIRNINWLITYYLIYEDVDDKIFKEKIEEYMLLHGCFIRRNISYFSSANNHIIGETLGLLITALLYNSDKLKEWIKFSINTLLRELIKQFYTDGVNKEQAVWYHTAVIDFYFLAFKFFKYANVEIDKKYLDYIEKGLEFIMYLYSSNIKMPNIGDRDDGFVLRFDWDNNYDFYRSVLASGAILFKREDFKHFSSGIDNRCIFLFGKKGIEIFNSLKDMNEVKLKDKNFEYGGYLIAYDKTNQLIFDYGNLGYLSIAAHGHADCLSVQLFKNNQPILIDPGTYCYNTDLELRRYFRSTKAHNTVRVDEKDQAYYGGPFLWLNHFKSKLLHYQNDNDTLIISAAHDGYKKIGVKHVRTLYFVKNKFILIHDSMFNLNKKEHTYELNYHLAQHVRVSTEGKYLILSGNTDSVVKLIVYPQVNVQVYDSYESYSFDEIHSTMCLQYIIKSKAPREDIYTLVMLDNNNWNLYQENRYLKLLSNTGETIILERMGG